MIMINGSFIGMARECMPGGTFPQHQFFFFCPHCNLHQRTLKLWNANIIYKTFKTSTAIWSNSLVPQSTCCKVRWGPFLMSYSTHFLFLLCTQQATNSPWPLTSANFLPAWLATALIVAIIITVTIIKGNPSNVNQIAITLIKPTTNFLLALLSSRHVCPSW